MFPSFFASSRNLLRRFARSDRGDVSVEAVILLPVLLTIFGAAWVYFDALQQRNTGQKANYVLSDMLSRETRAIDGTYVDASFELLRLLSQADEEDALGLRVTVVSFDERDDAWSVEWSKARGTKTPMAEGRAPEDPDRLPTGLNGDHLILVETSDPYNPVLDVGLAAQDFETYSFTRPRYAAQLASAE